MSLIKSQTFQLINRLVSASTPSDALDSVHALTSTLSSALTSPTSAFEDVLSLLTDSMEFMKTICILLSESKVKISNHSHNNNVYVEEGDVAVLSFLTVVLEYYNKNSNGNKKTTTTMTNRKTTTNRKTNKKLNLKLLSKLFNNFEEEDFRLSLSIIHSLLDVISTNDAANSNTPTGSNDQANRNSNVNSSSSSTLYKQSTTITILSKLLSLVPTQTINNILQTPNGLNRIIDLFKRSGGGGGVGGGGGDDDEKVILRNQSIILAIDLVKLNPGISKLMIFEEVYDHIMSIALHEFKSYLNDRYNRNLSPRNSNKSNTNNNDNGDPVNVVQNANLIIVKDCLELCIEMTKQELKMGSEMFLSNVMTCHVLTVLLDLRHGLYYRDYNLCVEDYEEIVKERKKIRNGGFDNTRSSSSSSGMNDNGSRQMNRFRRRGMSNGSEDGLDDLLGTSSFTDKPTSPEKGANGEVEEPKTLPIPYSTTEEAKIISKTLTLLQCLIKGGGGDDGDNTNTKEKKEVSSGVTSAVSVSSHIQSIVSSKNTNKISMLLFDMALYTLPPPNSPYEYYVSAVPTENVQCQALSVMADLAKIAQKVSKDDDNLSNDKPGGNLLSQILNCPSVYLQGVECLERVMYLICTGGISFVIDDDDDGDNDNSDIKKDESIIAKAIQDAVMSAQKISIHSLGLLRNLLTPKEASLMVMHTLVPPSRTPDPAYPVDDSTTTPKPPPPQEVPVVQKLINTMGENLHLLNNPTFSADLKTIDKERMQINIIGAAGALGIFLTNGAGDTTREMLLRIPLPPPPRILENMDGSSKDMDESSNSLIECIMTYLEMSASSTSDNANKTSPAIETSQDVTLSLLRLLMEWIPKTPQVISALLSNPNSVSLGFLLQQKTKKQKSSSSTAPKAIQAMSGVLLGLCMEYMESEIDIGGWSTSSIMNLINVGLGIGKYTQLLEGLKVIISNSNYNGINIDDEKSNASSVGPWTCCTMERIVLLNWYSENVNIVRRKAVQELSLASIDDDDDDDEFEESGNANGTASASDKKNMKSLSRLVAHQTSEIESLRQKLAESENALTSQESEMTMLKNRIGSNPNKLDDMLDEYSARIIDLGKETKGLREETEKINADNKATIQQRDNEILQLKSELEESQIEIKRIVAENVNTKEEMTNLSTAYSNLETEYNRVTSEGSSGQAIGDMTAETKVSSSVASESLKTENTKLKNDIGVANDWMSKAVKRMDDLGKRNSVLEAEVQHLSNTSLLNGSQNSAQHQEVAVVKLQLHEVKAERDRLQSSTEAYEKKIENLNETIQGMKIQGEVEQSSLQSRLMQSQDDMKNEKGTLSETISHLNDQIREKDEMIVDMKHRIEVCQKTSQNETSEKLEKKYTQLSSAYKAAQEWMANAVKHNESLKKQVEEMKNTNSVLRNNVGEADLSLQTKMRSLEEQIASLLEQRNEAIQSKTLLETKINETCASQEKIANENAGLLKSIEDLSEKVSEKDARNEQLQEHFNLLTAKSMAAESDLEKQQIIFAGLESEVEALRAENSNFSIEKDQYIEQIEEMRNRLTEFQSWTDTAQQRLADLEEENKYLQEERTELETREKKLKEEQIDATKNMEEISKELEERKQSDELEESELKRLQAEILGLHVEIGNLDGKNRALSEDNKVLEKKNTDLTSKADLLDEVEESLFEKENEVTMVQKELALVKDTMEKIQNESGGTISEWRGKTEELESIVREKETQLIHQEAEAREAILKWEERCEVISAEIAGCKQERDEMRKSFRKLEAEISLYNVSIEELNETLQVQIDEKDMMSKQIEESEVVYRKHIEDLEKAIQEHVEANEQFEAQLDERDDALVRAGEEIDLLNKDIVDNAKDSEEVVSKWQENSEQLEATIVELEATFQNQDNDANVAIAQWEARCTTLTEQIAEFENEFNNNNDDLTLTIEALQSELSMKENEHNQTLGKIRQLSTDLEVKNKHIKRLEAEMLAIQQTLDIQIENHKDDMASIVQNISSEKSEMLDRLQSERLAYKQAKSALKNEQKRIVELEGKLIDLSLSVETVSNEKAETMERLHTERLTSKQAQEALDKIQKTKVELENKLHAMSTTIQTISNEKAETLDELDSERHTSEQAQEAFEMEQQAKNELENKLHATEKLLEEVTAMRDKTEQEKMEIEQVFDEEQQQTESRIHMLEEEKRFLEESNDIDRAEANEMRLIIGQLENELKEANDMLQSHLTDEVSARATEMATNALRAQLKESREKHSYEHDAYVYERDARQLAEQEVEKLKSDLALLLQVEGVAESNDSRMHQLTSKAAGQVMERERGEIDSLTKSLLELMEELKNCQSKEREAEERAANSRLHATACEQELLAVKSDMSLLKDSINHMKQDETDLRSSLEHRVRSLEEERGEHIQSTTTEIKNLKAEISQCQMERDRLIHALDESEKANSALVYSTSTVRGGNNSPMELELAKLRLEKAQLLAAVQENSSKAEHRMRCVPSDEDKENRSSEKELIKAADKSLKILQQKHDETAAQLGIANASNIDLLNTIKESNVSGLKNDLYRLETEMGKLQQTNQSLKQQLGMAENESKSANAALEEKCRLADAKIRELENQERKETALAAEIARLRDETALQNNGLKNNGVSSERMIESKEAAMGADEMHDFILELNQAVKEERKMYHDLLAEHEDLLALLAQQDLEKTSLQAALTDSVGQDAVDMAILEAEEQAVEQFGKYIRLK